MFLRYLAAYAAAAVAFCVLDLLWLGVVARGWYRDRLGDLLLASPRVGAAVLFYAVFLVGLVVFAVAPALKSGRWTDALAWGALYGFFTYFTYDMTNLATLRGWPVSVVAVDVAWGVVLNAAVATAAFGVAGRIGS
jgi:uncharacterized membrane protein